MKYDGNYNPEENANIFSKTTFHWIQELLNKGFKTPLTADDIFPCHTKMQSKTLFEVASRYWELEKRKTKPSFAKVIFKANRRKCILVLILSIIESIFLVLPTLLVGKVSSYFDPNSTLTKDETLMYSCLLFATNFTYLILRSFLYWYLHQLGPSIRVQIATLVYDKACRISYSALGKTSIGHVITLMTNDAERFNQGLVPMHAVLNIPIVMVAAVIISYFTIGFLPMIISFVAVFLFIPLQSLTGKGVQKCRRVIAPYTDKRIKIIGETIASMKIIKMYKWESVFKNAVSKVRKLETKYIGFHLLLMVSANVINTVTPQVGLLAFLVTKYLTSGKITSEMVFFFMIMGELLRKNLNWGLGSVFMFAPQFRHSLQRVQAFLLIEEQQTSTNVCIENKMVSDIDKELQIPDDDQDAIQLQNMTSTWHGDNCFILSEISMKIPEASLIGILGPVGAGKSSIIMSIIQEMDVIGGGVNCRHAIGYYSQIPWIFNGTVRENILFNRKLDDEMLNRVIEACYLEKDLEMLPSGLDTLVGERGVQLSGGQRARVSLARVIYGDEDVVLLDDPLSAVDTKCANHLFNRLITETLKDKTVVLITHNTEYLSQLDYIYLMSKAEKQGEHIVGKISHRGTYQELSEQGLIKEQEKIKEGEDKEEDKNEEEENGTKKDKIKQNKVQEDRKTGLIDKKMYFRFFSLSYGMITFPLILILVAAAQALKILQEQHSLDWTETVVKTGDKSTDIFVKYVLFTVGCIAMYTLAGAFLARSGILSAKRLHDMAFNGILHTKIRYFDITPIGILINRFSKDTYFADERIVFTFGQFITMMGSFLASMVILCIANYYFVLILIPFIILFAFTLYFFLRTSVEVRRVEAIERSPVMSHISGTLNGISTIRASRQVDVYREEHFRLRDRHTSSQMMFKATERWLSIRLDAMVVLIGFIASLICIFLKDIIGYQLAGLGIVYIQNRLGQFQYSIRLGAECENLMTAVERIFALSELKPEESKREVEDNVIENKAATRSGVIQFKDVFLSYDVSLPVVLKNINFVTKPAEKIGVVGRTGAGKSSLIQALYRMYEVKGTILIDGIDTATLSLGNLRQSLSVIPQESLLFSGTLRGNLDPYDVYTDEELWDSLEQVQLKTYVQGKGGLVATEIDEMGSNMSVGQRQLLCLARALLKKSSVLVVDEATANVDQDTDREIQRTIKSCFKDRTVLTIAHRLNTIIDSDRVMVMDDGALVEFDTPDELLIRTDSLFYGLVHGSKSKTE